MFKYNLGQLVYYFVDNKIHSGGILSRSYVDNLLPKDEINTEQQKKIFALLGDEGILYTTIHDTFKENELFSSEEDLRKSIF
jgi:hypothetical protein